MKRFFIYFLFLIFISNITVLPCHCDENPDPRVESSNNKDQQNQ